MKEEGRLMVSPAYARGARTRVRTTSVGVGSPTAVGVCGYLTLMVRPGRTQEVT